MPAVIKHMDICAIVLYRNDGCSLNSTAGSWQKSWYWSTLCRKCLIKDHHCNHVGKLLYIIQYQNKKNPVTLCRNWISNTANWHEFPYAIDSFSAKPYIYSVILTLDLTVYLTPEGSMLAQHGRLTARGSQDPTPDRAGNLSGWILRAFPPTV